MSNSGPHRWYSRIWISAVSSRLSVVACWLISGNAAFAVDFGDEVPKDKYPAVGRVTCRFVRDGKEVGANGTGTLIAPDIVLTVAHVVSHASTPYHLTVKFESQEKPIHGIAYRTHPGYLSSRVNGLSPVERQWLKTTTGWDINSCDIALIKLEQPVPGLETYPLAEEYPAPQTALTVVGYGNTAAKTSDDKRRSGDLKVVRVHNNMLLVMPGNAKNQRPDHGDSGGPLLVKHGDRFEIAAAVHGIPGNDRLNGLTSDEWAAMTAIPYIKPWADAMIAELGEIKLNAQRPVAFIVRQQSANAQLALSRRQMGALVELNRQNSDNNYIRLFSRGLNEPIPVDVCVQIRKEAKVPETWFFPPLKAETK